MTEHLTSSLLCSLSQCGRKNCGVAFQQLQVFVTFTLNLLKGYKNNYSSLERLRTTNNFQYGCYKTKTKKLVMNDEFVNHLVVIGDNFSNLALSFRLWPVFSENR